MSHSTTSLTVALTFCIVYFTGPEDHGTISTTYLKNVTNQNQEVPCWFSLIERMTKVGEYSERTIDDAFLLAMIAER